MSLLNLDPVSFAQNYLTLEGSQFRLIGNGYKPFADIYRYIGIKALEPDSKPVILVKGRQVGGTIMACVLEMYFMGSGIFGIGSKPPMRVMHAFPLLSLSAAYSKTKLNPMILNSIRESAADKTGKSKSFMQTMLDQSTPTNDSLTFKQFKGGNHLWIESTGVDSDRLMGRTCDVIFFDEVQKMSSLALGNAVKILTSSQYGKPGKGVQVYFGTPRKKGSDYHKMWLSSTQQYFYLGCEKCKKHFPLYTPESDEWESIWIRDFIVKCPHCGQEQDKREAADRGKWVATKDYRDPDCKLIGFHINQLYFPKFTREDIENEKPGKHPINTERIYRTEVLGEFFQGDTSPITPEEIAEACADRDRKFSARISPNEKSMVVLGIDYGQRSDIEQLADADNFKLSGQSYSTAVVLSVKGPSLLYIEFCTKFKRNDPESKRGIIDHMMRNYSVDLAVGDIGYSNDFSPELHNIYGDKYLVSRAQNKVNNYVRFRDDTFPKEIMFERDYHIRELYELLKKGQIKFPFRDYEKCAWLIDHCASMEIKPSISKTGGDPVVHYVKGNTPNDGFMALLNAYLAYKFLISKGFKNNNPFTQQEDFKNNKPLVISGYIPRRF
jgi:ssDNA-binding Zn-finger/Zn-ribbon topoisomerase 1